MILRLNLLGNGPEGVDARHLLRAATEVKSPAEEFIAESYSKVIYLWGSELSLYGMILTKGKNPSRLTANIQEVLSELQKCSHMYLASTVSLLVVLSNRSPKEFHRFETRYKNISQARDQLVLTELVFLTYLDEIGLGEGED